MNFKPTKRQTTKNELQKPSELCRIGFMANVERITELKRRRTRKTKLRKIRQKYITAKTEDEKSAALSKMTKVAPWLSEEEFLSAVKK